MPSSIAQTILGSLGGALAVAGNAGGSTGFHLARAARAAFMSGNQVSLAVGGVVSLVGAVFVLAALRSRAR